jgi:hypothetical protein
VSELGLFTELHGELKAVSHECEQEREQVRAEKEDAAAKKAAEILSQLRQKAKAAARDGSDSVLVVEAIDEYREPWWSAYSWFYGTYFGWLTGASRLVFDECARAGLQPFLRWKFVRYQGWRVEVRIRV